MAKQPLLAGLVVVRRDEQRTIDPELLRFFRIGHGVLRRVGAGAGQNFATAFCNLNRQPNDLFALFM